MSINHIGNIINVSHRIKMKGNTGKPIMIFQKVREWDEMKATHAPQKSLSIIFVVVGSSEPISRVSCQYLELCMMCVLTCTPAAPPPVTAFTGGSLKLRTVHYWRERGNWGYVALENTVMSVRVANKTPWWGHWKVKVSYPWQVAAPLSVVTNKHFLYLLVLALPTYAAKIIFHATCLHNFLGIVVCSPIWQTDRQTETEWGNHMTTSDFAGAGHY